MRFHELSDAYARLEATSKRLEMRGTLVGLIQKTPAKDLPAVLYLSQGLLRPEYEGVELGVAGSLARRAVALATNTPEADVTRRTQASGDLGLTTEELLRRTQRLAPPSPLEVEEVYARLTDIARASGSGSQEVKVRTLVDLLSRAQPEEARYLVRFVLGTLRVGVREMTILDALAVAFAPDAKDGRPRIEAGFNLTSDLGLIAERLAEGGLSALDHLRIEVGRPIRPMLAERSTSLADVLERMEGAAALEFKYDGLRVQAHVGADGHVRLFSRRLEEIGPQFPDLIRELPAAIRRRPAIVEGECVPFDPQTGEIQPFQLVSRRRGRKHDLERLQEEIPVELFLFDLLLEGDTPTYERPFPERRDRLQKLLTETERIRLAEQEVVRSVDSAQAFFDRAVAEGAEGVMAKSIAPNSSYRAGARGFWWIKYKREYTQGLGDSIDGVLVGAFHGRGRRAGRYGAFLLAVYNPRLDRFESFCKVGTGFDDAALDSLTARIRRIQRADRPAGVDTGITPDVWTDPGPVLEVRGAELTLSPVHRAAVGAVRAGAGLALRFPRFTGRYRDDKGPAEATTAEELLQMYRSQVRHEEASPSDPDAA